MEVKTYCHNCGNELEVIGYIYKNDLILFPNLCKCMKQGDKNHKIIVCTAGKDKDDYNKIVTEFI